MTGTLTAPVGAPVQDTVPRGRGPRRRVRMPLVAAGGVLVLVCVLGFAYIAAQVGHRVVVLQVARAVAAGQTITAADVTRVQAPDDPGLRLIPASRSGDVVGRSAAVPLVAGTLLTDRLVGDVVWPPAGQLTAAVSLKRVPAGLAAGQPVTVFIRASSSNASSGSSPDATSGAGVSGTGAAPGTGSGGTGPVVPARFEAVVVSVQPAADGQGAVVVTLLLSASDAAVLAAAPDDGVVVMRGEQGR